MKRIFYLIILIAIFQIFVGPSFANSLTDLISNKFMDDCLNSWVGYKIDSAIDRWGYPTEEKVIAGRKVFIWDKRKVVQDASYTTGNAYTSSNANVYGMGNMAYGTGYSNTNFSSMTLGGETYVKYCTRFLEVDKDNKIIKSSWQGNNCPVTYFTGKKFVNPQNDKWQQEKELKKQNKNK